MRFLPLACFFFCYIFAFAQSSGDMGLLMNNPPVRQAAESDAYNLNPVQNDRRPMRASDRWYVKVNPLRLFFSGSMLFYQGVVSPQLSSQCVFGRTCSNYAKEAFYRFGMIRGILMGADRLMRCNISTFSGAEPWMFDSNGKIIDEPQRCRNN